MDIKSVASEASTILQNVMNIEPEVATVIGFIPGASAIEGMVQPVLLAVAPAIEKALAAIAAGDTSGAVDPVAELIKHILPGLPNAPALAPATT
jgi:hypothetical protein